MILKSLYFETCLVDRAAHPLYIVREALYALPASGVGLQRVPCLLAHLWVQAVA